MSNTFQDWNKNVIEEFRANGGDVTAGGFGRRLILVHHTGAKSGTERITPLVSMRDGDDVWIIAASKAGSPENPDWYYNLVANPNTVIEAPGEGEVPVTVEVLEGSTRDTVWERFTAANPGFKNYEEITTRTIPVLALRRRATDS